MNFFAGATSLDSFLKSYKTKETKGFFPHEWADCPEIMNNKELPPYDSFFSILSSRVVSRADGGVEDPMY